MRLTMSKTCENHRLHLNADLEKHIHTEDLKDKHVYESKHEFVRFGKTRQAVLVKGRDCWRILTVINDITKY